MHGYGKETNVNGLKYIGNYSKGRKEGKGKMTWSDGNSYDGDW